MLKWLYLMILVSFNLLGCTLGPDFKSPEAPKTNRYLNTHSFTQTVSAHSYGGQTQIIKYNQDIPASWWTLYHSKSLNFLIDEGVKNNPDLTQMWIKK